MTSQLNTVTVIIEEFSVKAVSLKGNPWRLYGAKHLPPQNATTYLSMNVLRLAKNELKKSYIANYWKDTPPVVHTIHVMRRPLTLTLEVFHA